MNNDLENRIKVLEDTINSLRASYSIPLDIRQAFNAGLTVGSSLSTSVKSSSSENQAVDEGGVATYSVMKAPDGFLEINISGTVYYLPYFS